MVPDHLPEEAVINEAGGVTAPGQEIQRSNMPMPCSRAPAAQLRGSAVRQMTAARYLKAADDRLRNISGLFKTANKCRPVH